MSREGERGQATVFVALTLVALCGAAALGVDVGRGYLAQFRLQSATDAAALAGAWCLAPSGGSGPPPQCTSALATAQSYAQDNGAPGATVTINAARTEVTVQAKTSVPTTFARVLGIDTIPVQTESRAVAPTAPACYPVAACAAASGSSGASSSSSLLSSLTSSLSSATSSAASATGKDGDADGDGAADSDHDRAEAEHTGTESKDQQDQTEHQDNNQRATCDQIEKGGSNQCVPSGGNQMGLAPLWADYSAVSAAFASGGCAWTSDGCPEVQIKWGTHARHSNRGALSLGGHGAAAYERALAQGVDTPLNIGSQVYTKTGNMDGPTDTGLAALCQADASNPYVVMPVAHYPGEGYKSITVLGFVAVRLQCPAPGGGNIYGRFVAAILPGVGNPAADASAAYFGLLHRGGLVPN